MDKRNEVKQDLAKASIPRIKVAGFGGGHRQVIAEKPKSFKKTMMRIWEYFDGEHGMLMAMSFFMILSSAIGVFVPYIIGKAIDTMGTPRKYVDFRILIIVAISMTIAYILDAALNFFQAFILAGVSQRMVKRLRKVLFHKLQLLPVSYFDTRSKGDIMSRLSNDIDNVSTTVSQSLLQLMSGIISIGGSLAMMIYLSPLMTFATIVTVPLVFLLTRTVAKKTAPLFREQQSKLGKLNGTIEESISGIYVVKAFNHEDKIIDQFAKTNEELRNVGIRAQILSGLIMPLMNVINNIGFTIVAWIGGIMAVKGTNTVIYHTKKDLATWTQFLNYLIRQFSLRRCAKELNISLNTAFYWRHKILDALREHSKTTELSGTITIHDTHLRRSFKGNHTNNNFYFPRKPRTRGNIMNYESISEEQVCILSAIDSNNNLLMEPICFSHLRNTDVVRVLVPIIKPSSRLITDIRWAYKMMCTKFNFKHTIVRNYSIKIINNLHKILKTFLNVYKGVATKYLSNYLTLFKYIKNNKICKFTKNIPSFDSSINYPLANELILLLRGDFPCINSNFCGRRTVFT